MRGFDASQVHGEVFGISGVKWEQNGILYTYQGEPVVIKDGRVERIELPPEPEPVAGDMSIDELRAHAKVYGVEGYETMTRKQLDKALNS